MKEYCSLYFSLQNNFFGDTASALILIQTGFSSFEIAILFEVMFCFTY